MIRKIICTLLLANFATAYPEAQDNVEKQQQTETASSSESNSKNLDSGFFGSEWYISWGYNKEYWAPSDIHVSQKSLGNDFTLHDVRATDYPQWDTDFLIFDKGPTVPQYSLRVGRFLNEERTFALELNIDHSKYSSVIGQTAHVTGTIGNQAVDTHQELTSSYFRYNLHNGVNHLMVNAVYRLPLLGKTNHTLSLAGLAKGGIGIVLPHAENTIMGKNSDVGKKKLGNYVGLSSGWWQLNGWTIGAEIGFRFVVYAPIFIEFTNKVAFAALYNVPVYQGTASHNLWMEELILSIGVTLGE